MGIDEQLAGLPPELQQHARELVAKADPGQLAWLGGYFTGLSAGGTATLPSPGANHTEPSRQLTILFGSQTGNSEEIAEQALHLLVNTDRAARGF